MKSCQGCQKTNKSKLNKQDILVTRANTLKTHQSTTITLQNFSEISPPPKKKKKLPLKNQQKITHNLNSFLELSINVCGGGNRKSKFVTLQDACHFSQSSSWISS